MRENKTGRASDYHGEQERIRPLGRCEPEWQDIILNNMWGCEVAHFAHCMTQWVALENTVMNIRVPWKARKYLN